MEQQIEVKREFTEQNIKVNRELLQIVKTKEIDDLSMVDDKLRISFIDGDYIESPDLSATYKKKGIMRFADSPDIGWYRRDCALMPSQLGEIVHRGLLDAAYFSTSEKNLAAYKLGYMRDTILEERLQDLTEIAEGKTKTFTLSYNYPDNEAFNSQNNSIIVEGFTDMDENHIGYSDVKIGDIVLVTETDVPDRWVQSIDEDEGTITLYKMETSKIDLTNYAQKSYVDNAVATKQDIDVTIDNTTQSVTQWLSFIIQNCGKPISSITVDNFGRIKITYTDGTYTQSGRIVGYDGGYGFVKPSKYFFNDPSNNGQMTPRYHATAARTSTGRKDSGTTDGHQSIVRLQNIDKLVVDCLIDNWVYNAESPISAEDKAKIASLLGYMLSSDVSTALAGKQDVNVTIGNVTHTVAEWLGLKQDVLTFDNSPTSGSNNPVTSGGVYTAINTAVGDIDTALTGLISGGGVV